LAQAVCLKRQTPRTSAVILLPLPGQQDFPAFHIHGDDQLLQRRSPALDS